jgi:hypothetical protein
MMEVKTILFEVLQEYVKGNEEEVVFITVKKWLGKEEAELGIALAKNSRKYNYIGFLSTVVYNLVISTDGSLASFMPMIWYRQNGRLMAWNQLERLSID